MSEQYPKTITPDFVGPPQKSPFDDFDKEKLAQFDKALAIADGVKMYMSAGGMGAASHWRPYAEQLASRGGLTESEALTLGRYRMWKQGVPVVPLEATPPRTPGEVAARGQELRNAPLPRKAQIIDEDNTRQYNENQNFFSDLVKKKPELKVKLDGVESAKPAVEEEAE